MNLINAALNTFSQNQCGITFKSGKFIYKQHFIHDKDDESSDATILEEIKQTFSKDVDEEAEELRRIRDDFDVETSLENVDLTRFSEENIFVKVLLPTGESTELEILYNSTQSFNGLIEQCYSREDYDVVKNDVVVFFEGNIIQNMRQSLIDRDIFPGDEVTVTLKEFSNNLYIKINENLHSVLYKANYTLFDLRTQIESVCGISAGDQMLSVEGKNEVLSHKISSKMTLADHGIFSGETIVVEEKSLSSNTDIFLTDNDSIIKQVKHCNYLTVSTIRKKLKDLEQFHFVFENNEIDENASFFKLNIFPGDTIYLIKKDSKNPLIFYDPSFMDVRGDAIYPPLPNTRGYNKRRKVDFLDYSIPFGWIQKGIKCIGKYSDDNWLKDDRSSSWKVSYHGTKTEFASGISQTGYLLSRGVRFVYGYGVYSTPDPDVAEQYATKFHHNGYWYKLILMNRVNMDTTNTVYVPGIGVYYVTSKETHIRPFAILYKKV